jgi:FixJ family two-component response regulator
MGKYFVISLVDENFDRRSRCFAALAESQFHIEPYDGVAEFLKHRPAGTLILAPDEDETLTDLLSNIRQQDSWSPVIGYGEPLDPIRCSQLFLQGLVGYLPVPFDHKDLEALLAGADDQLSAVIGMHRGVDEARDRLKKLTSREAEVLDALQAGLTSRQIAETLGISRRTVEVHRSNMLRKIGTKTMSAAVRMSVQARLNI